MKNVNWCFERGPSSEVEWKVLSSITALECLQHFFNAFLKEQAEQELGIELTDVSGALLRQCVFSVLVSFFPNPKLGVIACTPLHKMYPNAYTHKCTV